MDENHDEKRDSIDDILSDLNGLLSKMPSLLDGIKMPEVQPEEFSSTQAPAAPAPQSGPPAPQPEALNDIPAGSDNCDKTIVLESFAGLAVGAQASGEIPAGSLPLEQFPSESAPVTPGPIDADKTVVLESFSGLFEGAPVPAEIPVPLSPKPAFSRIESVPAPGSASPAEEEKKVVEESSPVPQELSEVFSADSGAAIPEQIMPVVRNPGESVPVVETRPEQEKPEAALPVIPKAAADQMVFTQDALVSFSDSEDASEEQAEAPDYGSTRDFGIPDIDELMQMSHGEKPAEQPARVLPEAGLIPESVQAIEEEKSEPSMPALAAARPEAGEAELFDGRPAEAAPAQTLEEEPRLSAAAPEGDTVEPKEPEEEKSELPREEAVSPVMEPGAFIIEPEVKPRTSFEAFTIEPSSPEPMPESDGGETLRLESAPEVQSAPDGGETLRFEPASEAVAGAAQEPPPAGLQEMQFAFTPPAAEPDAEAGSGIQLEPSAEAEVEPAIEGNPGTQFGSGAEPAAGAGIELAPGIELGAGSPAQSVNFGETLPGGSGLELGGGASPSLSGDETLVADAPAGSSGEEDKTVVFQARPSTTSMAKAGDLAALAVRQVPEGIPAERVRTLAFLYSSGDEALCATVLSELDAICLKSAFKPMFIKRAYVKECDVDSNANFVLQSVTDSGAAGLICLGAVPQEKVYEIENVFSSSGGFFRYYEAASFVHSTALDLVSDLIIR